MHAFIKIRFYERIACKHKGLKMAEAPKDYLQWLSGTDLDEDLAYTVRHYLGGLLQGPEYDSGI